MKEMVKYEEIKRKHARFPAYADDAGVKLQPKNNRPTFKSDDNWIITDMRFPNELEAVKKHNGITIRINRGLVERTGNMIQEPEHISETALDNYEFTHVISNNGTIEELIERVKEIILIEKII